MLDRAVAKDAIKKNFRMKIRRQNSASKQHFCITQVSRIDALSSSRTLI